MYYFTTMINNVMKTPKTLLEAVNYFSNDAICVKFLENFRWADGKPHCPKCGSDNVCCLKTRPAYRCRETGCKKSFSLKTGSVMEDSALPITKWVPAIWFVINHRNGVSSCEVARALGITQKSAWHLCHRIRKAVSNGSFEKMGKTNAVELDETYVGGKLINMHKGKREALKVNRRASQNQKTIVMGILERGVEVRAKVVDRATTVKLLTEVYNNVEEGATVHTDALKSYQTLANDFNHSVVDHRVEYVNGDCHTNGLENFWSCFKRSVKGTYIQIASFHTDRYLAEQTFRWNYRKATDSERFEAAVGKMFGKRLTYAELTGTVVA